MKVLAVITARKNSKSLPGKNKKLLYGVPLVVYTFLAAKKSRLITDLILSTDDEEIIELAKKYDIAAPFVRPKSLAGDQVGHVPVLQHALEFMEQQTRRVFDYIVTLQPTSPFRIAEDIDVILEKVIQGKAESGVTVSKWPGAHPYKAKIFKDGFIVPMFAGEQEVAGQGNFRQQLPPAFKRDGGVYVTSRLTLIEKGSVYGQTTVGYEVDSLRSVDIDTEEDWAVAEFKYRKLKDLGFFETNFDL